MREILHLQVGNCGNQLGKLNWENIFDEYSIDINGKLEVNNENIQEKIGVYLEEKQDQKYIARNISICKYNEVLNPGFYFKNHYDERDFIEIENSWNWAKGYYRKEGDDDIRDLVRAKAEACDSLQAFEFSHSLGGGSGSGLTSRIIETLKDEFSDILFCFQTVFPSPKVSDCVVEPYNVVLSFPFLHMPDNLIFAIDIESLMRILLKRYKIPNPTYGDINHLAAQVLGGATSTFRFPGMINGDLKKMMKNLAPIETMNFLVPGFSPFTCRCNCMRHSGEIQDFFRDIVSENAMCEIVETNRITSMACCFRGFEEKSQQIEDFFRSEGTFVNGIEIKNIKYSMTEFKPRGLKRGASSLINTTGFKDILNRIHQDFDFMKRRNAFLHWYLSEGVEIEEFNQASHEVIDLIETYRSYEN
ncbi:unnamed protein product [Blepharisma stoltei]|uniref:Tubulin beta chain n=1 Tax=Blepharisma stoltei TaxID=1481888 RepID=A0AAU9JN50_9CILI|nr:unnamed protein product [Blepharisma stoltei]